MKKLTPETLVTKISHYISFLSLGLTVLILTDPFLTIEIFTRSRYSPGLLGITLVDALTVLVFMAFINMMLLLYKKLVNAKTEVLPDDIVDEQAKGKTKVSVSRVLRILVLLWASSPILLVGGFLLANGGDDPTNGWAVIFAILGLVITTITGLVFWIALATFSKKKTNQVIKRD